MVTETKYRYGYTAQGYEFNHIYRCEECGNTVICDPDGGVFCYCGDPFNNESKGMERVACSLPWQYYKKERQCWVGGTSWNGELYKWYSYKEAVADIKKMNDRPYYVGASFSETTEWVPWDFKATKDNSKPVKIK